MRKLKHNLEHTLIALDQLVYCVIGTILSLFNPKIEVWADMTVSAQAHRLSNKGYWYGKLLEKTINIIFFNKNHCKEAYESEKNNSHLPDDMS